MVLVFWRPQEWLAPMLYGIPILYGVVAMSCVTLFAEVNAGRVILPKGPFIYLFAGLFFAALMSHIAWGYLAGFIDTFEEVWKLCFFAILLYCVTDRPARLQAIAIVFVVLSCIMSVHALMQQRMGYGFAFQAPLYQQLPESDEYMVRSLFFGIFEDPNDLAQILATSIPFAFLVTKSKGYFNLLIGGAVTALLVSGILATHSRGGQIALMAVGVTMVSLVLPKRWMLVMIVLLAAGALLACRFAGPYMDASAGDRVAFWGEANWAFKARPLFGVGYGMLGDYISDDRAIHNAFVLCYAELGLFGYWFWFTIIVAGIVGAWRTRVALSNSDSTDGQYVARFAGLAIAATVGFLVSSYFLTRAYVYPLFFLFVTLGAIAEIARPFLPDKTRSLALVGRDLLLYGTIGSFSSIAYIYVSILILNARSG